MIENGKLVTIHYTLTVNGEVIDSSRERKPLQYKHGSGQIIPGLERALEGLKPGDHEQIEVSPEDAYGLIDPEAVIEVSKDKIKGTEIELGTILQTMSPEGRVMKGEVKQIIGNQVLVDLNHPLAGKVLYFDVEVVEVV